MSEALFRTRDAVLRFLFYCRAKTARRTAILRLSSDYDTLREERRRGMNLWVTLFEFLVE